MNIFILVWSYLKARPLNTAINIVLLVVGYSCYHDPVVI